MKDIVNKNKKKKIQTKFKLENCGLTSDSLLISNKFNDFFVNIGPSLAMKIPKQYLNSLQYMGHPVPRTNFLSPVTHAEINQIIMGLQNGAVGNNETTALTLQLVALHIIILPAQRSCWGYIGFTPSVRLSVHPSVPRPSRIPCPLCSFYSSGWIHFIFMHLIKQLQKVCRVQSFLQNLKI